MEKNVQKRGCAWVWFGLLGLALGAGLGLAIAARLLAVHIQQVRAVSTPSPAITTIEAAERALKVGDLALARSLLTSLDEKSFDRETRARINGDLGDVEVALGRYKLAAGYYDKQFQFKPTPERLLKLAGCLSTAGQLEEAERRYYELANWPGSAADPYRQEAQEGLEMVRKMLGTRTP